MKPYQQISIEECNEALVEIPLEKFAVELPHPYEKLGAKYGDKSPFNLRKSVVYSLIQAQDKLQEIKPGWRIKIFDAYRPVAVQQFMVNYTFEQVINSRKLELEKIPEAEQKKIWEEVYKIWAIPSENPATPPPHTTGAAVDITLVNEGGETVEMGGEIDELSERSHPQYYANSNQEYHQKRELLNKIMRGAGFLRHPGEWWHFSQGDQMWAWQYNRENPGKEVKARYGRVE